MSASYDPLEDLQLGPGPVFRLSGQGILRTWTKRGCGRRDDELVGGNGVRDLEQPRRDRRVFSLLGEFLAALRLAHNYSAVDDHPDVDLGEALISFVHVHLRRE